MSRLVSYKTNQFTDPPITQLIFSDTRLAWVWAILRVYMAYTWITSGWGKFTNPAWVSTGDALKSFWVNAIKVDPKPVITFDWYRVFIQYLLDTQAYTWFAKLVPAGELLIGIALLLGAFTGIAAFFGGLMNWNFMMAGTTSVNPMFFTFSILLIVAWKTAGYWGLDRYLLPALGTPWRLGFALNPQAMANDRKACGCGANCTCDSSQMPVAVTAPAE